MPAAATVVASWFDLTCPAVPIAPPRQCTQKTHKTSTHGACFTGTVHVPAMQGARYLSRHSHTSTCACASTVTCLLPTCRCLPQLVLLRCLNHTAHHHACMITEPSRVITNGCRIRLVFKSPVDELQKRPQPDRTRLLRNRTQGCGYADSGQAAVAVAAKV
jgi:hypothetical protein